MISDGEISVCIARAAGGGRGAGLHVRKVRRAETAVVGRARPVAARKETRRKHGAGDGDRTRDIQLGKLTFYR